jgi:hypothetical protein
LQTVAVLATPSDGCFDKVNLSSNQSLSMPALRKLSRPTGIPANNLPHRSVSIPAFWRAALEARLKGYIDRGAFHISHSDGARVLHILPDAVISGIQQLDPEWYDFDRKHFRQSLRGQKEWRAGDNVSIQ